MENHCQFHEASDKERRYRCAVVCRLLRMPALSHQTSGMPSLMPHSPVSTLCSGSEGTLYNLLFYVV